MCVLPERGFSHRFIQYNTAGPKNPPSTPIHLKWGKCAKMHFYEENMNRTNQTNKLKHPRRPTEGGEQSAVTHIAQATDAR